MSVSARSKFRFRLNFQRLHEAKRFDSVGASIGRRRMIRRTLALSLVLALAACSQATQDNVGQAEDVIAADANATAAEAIKDTDAATDEALGAAEARIDNADDVIGNTADRAADKTGAALKNLGNEIED